MSIPWFIIITVAIIFGQSYIYSKWGLSRILYKRTFSKSIVFEGEEIEMVDEISNKKLLPIPWLRLESKIHASLKFRKISNQDNEIDSEEFHRTLFSLMPYQKVKRRQKLTCTQRGYFQFKTVSMTTGDAFGFGSSFESKQAKAELTVYPKLAPLDEIPLPSHSWLGDITVKRWIIEDPFVIAGVRDYSYGDPMNTINWKATARTNSLQVSKRDYTADHHLLIYLNFDETEDIWLPVKDLELFEQGISYAASLAQYTLSQGISTGFGCNAYLVEPFQNSTDPIKQPIRIQPSNGTHQLTYILDTMAKLRLDRSMSFNHFLLEDINRQMQNTDILLITTILTEKMEENIRILEENGNSVEIVWLQKEMVNNDVNDEAGERNVS